MYRLILAGAIIILTSFGKKDITEIFVQPYLSKTSYTDTIITDEEYTHLAKLCDSLRVMDRNECLSLLNEELDRYSKSVEVAKQKLEKDGALDLKISVLIGIAIAIMVL